MNAKNTKNDFLKDMQKRQKWMQKRHMGCKQLFFNIFFSKNHNNFKMLFSSKKMFFGKQKCSIFKLCKKS